MGPRGETGWGRSQPAAEGEGKLRREPQSAAGWAQPAGHSLLTSPPGVYGLFWKTLVSFYVSVCGSCCILEVI